MATCEFLTNHAKVLLCVAHDPDARLRDIASATGLTERAAHGLVSDLVDEGYVVRKRQGRRNSYRVKPHLHLPDPMVKELRVGELLEVLLGDAR
jgi:DNA-binding IclR family transcriptional regulator